MTISQRYQGTSAFITKKFHAVKQWLLVLSYILLTHYSNSPNEQLTPFKPFIFLVKPFYFYKKIGKFLFRAILQSLRDKRTTVALVLQSLLLLILSGEIFAAAFGLFGFFFLEKERKKFFLRD